MLTKDIVSIVGGFDIDYVARLIKFKIKEVETRIEIFIERTESIIDDIMMEPEEKRWMYFAAFDKKPLDDLVRQKNVLTRLITPGKKMLDIEGAKQRDIVEVAGNLGLEVKRRGSKHLALCPFHHEKTPSFVLYPEGRYFCYGCSAHGDVIDLYMKLADVNFPTAVKELS